ncbi:MAG: hypothetical protein WCT16_02840 [Candidatus Buchananbacteria bacterium]
MADILEKEPQIEMEYWEAIASIEERTQSINNDIHRGLYESSPEIIQFLIDAQETIECLVSKLFDKFGVIPPKDCPKVEVGQEMPPAPEGKIYYWDWYEAKEAEAKKQFYDGIICSVCPFSEGIDSMVGFNIPCGLWKGALYRLEAPHICAMLRDLSEKKLHWEIRQEAGRQALKLFKEKQAALQQAALEKTATEK